ncbi:solute carrier family 52, riboflavin transporter, member 3-A isoform X1 [Bemisia tabaci]|uniref:solute carrier family 52, riboflavin transporter, member 3-A isoform X1 n=2 Tax=Bemisia tabaci TaxID=7038 RepID=UPI0008F98600|nr:PREDICTED: solute carrier family 52, riboflavin transporter, member 3-A isoform X1 [Bemisia tabaci]
MIADEIVPLLNTNMRSMESSRALLVDILAALFGLGSWMSVNGMYNELPILVQAAPEGWSLPSYLSIIIQMANIGPLLYYFSKRNCPGFVKDSYVIAVILFLGALAMFHMAFNYDQTSSVFGAPHSTSLMAGTFFIALVGCTSSVLFFPFIGRFPETYLVSLLVGEGLSGFIPSGIALIQGIGDKPECKNVTQPDGSVAVFPELHPPRFSTQTYFLVIFSLMVVSLISFLMLNNLPICVKERKKRLVIDRLRDSPNPNTNRLSDDEFEGGKKAVILTPYSYGAMLLLQGVISFLANGSLPSLQSYSCLPYGYEVYHLCVTLVHIANPIACFMAYFVPHKSIRAISSLSAVLAVFVSYVITLAVLSPTPPLADEFVGKALVVFCWIVCSGLIAYTKLSIAALFNDAGNKGLFWYGVSTQLGAALGAASMFVLINILNLFKSNDICAGA